MLIFSNHLAVIFLLIAAEGIIPLLVVGLNKISKTGCPG
jgi:hypothetical protein